MSEKVQPPIRIDLNEFKLYIDIKNKIILSLHFDSPSRRFYLSLIAFVVNQMKKLGRITSIPLQDHLPLLVLLNTTVGSSAGSSEKENLLTRVYRKWKDVLPNLEEAHLYRVLGKKREYIESGFKAYPFTEEEKDLWANLFEYKGSKENVRLRFSMDKLGIGLGDVAILYEGYQNGDAWERFLSSLRKELEDTPEEAAFPPPPKISEAPVSLPKEERAVLQSRNRRIVLTALMAIMLGLTAVAAWRFSLPPTSVERASLERMAFPLPDKPSIAVLPFVNMSDDPKLEFFSDGLAEEIITALSKSPYLFVIARNSTFTYKGKSVNVKEVAEHLGVRYVLEGSVRRSGDKVRITAQLADAIKGHHLWAERYDRDLNDILAIQDDIALKILTALHVKLQAGDQAGETGRGTKKLEAFLKTMEAREYVLRYTPEDNAFARRLLEETISLDPDYARAYSILAASHAANVWLGVSPSPKESLERAIELGKKALALDESDATVHALLAYLFAMTRQFDRAVPQAERALALDPNSYAVLHNSGLAFAYSGRPQDAIPLFQRAIRLDPLSVDHPHRHLSMAYRMVGRYDDAVVEARKAAQGNPKSFLNYSSLAASCILAGRQEEGRAAAAEVLKINPSFSLERFSQTIPYKDKSHADLMITALRKAGLK